MSTRFTHCGLAFGVAFGVLTSTAWAQESKSAPLAKELTTLLAQNKLDSVAARDRTEPNRFVAALYMPGQLLVISAQYAEPSLINERLVQQGYKDVYMDLQSASVPASRMFVDDTGGDGLRARPEAKQAYDSMESGGSRKAFDGAWKKQKLSEADYTKAFGTADESYAQMLTLLLTELKSRKPAS